MNNELKKMFRPDLSLSKKSLNISRSSKKSKDIS